MQQSRGASPSEDRLKLEQGCHGNQRLAVTTCCCCWCCTAGGRQLLRAPCSRQSQQSGTRVHRYTCVCARIYTRRWKLVQQLLLDITLTSLTPPRATIIALWLQLFLETWNVRFWNSEEYKSWAQTTWCLRQLFMLSRRSAVCAVTTFPVTRRGKCSGPVLNCRITTHCGWTARVRNTRKSHLRTDIGLVNNQVRTHYIDYTGFFFFFFLPATLPVSGAKVTRHYRMLCMFNDLLVLGVHNVGDKS